MRPLPRVIKKDARHEWHYEYDDFGQLLKMHTFRSGTPTATSIGHVTTWNYDSATGVLLSKTDAASKGVTTTYDPATGRVWKRTLARKTPGGQDIIITYGYDDAGHLTTIDYSDDTPDVVHTYHTDGQLATTLDAAGLHTYQYNGPGGQLSGETITGGLLGGSSWSSTFVTAPGENGQNLRDVYTWTWAGVGSRSIDYDYDAAGRLSKVSAFGHSATYGYETATGRKHTVTYSGAGLTGTWNHDPKGRLDVITWKVGAKVLSRHDYGFDALHRRTSAERETGETWRYGYNDRGEVESAVKKADNTVGAAAKRGLQSGYGYDLIGNRIMDQQHTPSSGNSLSEAVWTANALNQITARENHDSRWVFGHVKQAASLSVTGNSGEVIRDEDEFAIPVSRTGTATAADWHSLDVTATLAGAGRVVNGTALDVTTQRHGKVWFPTSPEDLQYDDDGNLTQDGRWNFTWDAENRLIRAETRADVATATGMPRERLDMAYDAMGRRIRKAVYRLETLNLEPATWVLKSDLRFLYEGASWNLVAELNLKPETSNLELIRSYAWGTDISGTVTGAGGVGGLLFVQQLSTTANNSQPSSTVSAPCYDGNGNVSAYVRVQSGTVSSRHDYDAFGRPVWSELEGTGGRQAAASPFGFSTKYTDVETGWCYYGHRFYIPELARWPSKDPIEENGGTNLYAMVGNNPVDRIDVNGHGPLTAYKIIRDQHTPYAVGVSLTALLQLDLPDSIESEIKSAFPNTTFGAGAGYYFFPDTCEIAGYFITAGKVSDFLRADGSHRPEMNTGAMASAGFAPEIAYYHLKGSRRGDATADSFLGPFVTGSIVGLPVSIYVGMTPGEIGEYVSKARENKPLPPFRDDNRWYGGTISPPGVSKSWVFGAALTTWYYDGPFGHLKLTAKHPTLGKCACAAIAATMVQLP